MMRAGVQSCASWTHDNLVLDADVRPWSEYWNWFGTLTVPGFHLFRPDYTRLNMPRLCRVLLSLSLMSLVSLALGCGGDGPPPDRPATVQVTGTLTYNGEPVGGASISLKNTGNGPGAAGISDANGKYTLTTFTSGDGAVPGEYLVGVIKSEIVGADTSYFDVESPNYGKTPPPEAEGKLVHHIPEKFNNPDTSGIRVTISEGQDSVPIELKD